MTPENQRVLRCLRDECLGLAYELNPDYEVSPLEGYCAVVACIVQGSFGGDIMGGDVNGEPHFWNRLPCGTEVDFTSCQFGGDGCTPLVAGTVQEKPEITPLHSVMFAMEIVKRLNRPTGSLVPQR